MDLQTATESFRSKVGDDSGLGATLKFDCGADGVIVIDGASSPNTVDNTNRDTDCTIALSLDTLGEMMSGELNPMNAFIEKHKLTPVIDRTFDFVDAKAAIDHMRSGDFVGKIVIRIGGSEALSAALTPARVRETTP